MGILWYFCRIRPISLSILLSICRWKRRKEERGGRGMFPRIHFFICRFRQHDRHSHAYVLYAHQYNGAATSSLLVTFKLWCGTVVTSFVLWNLRKVTGKQDNWTAKKSFHSSKMRKNSSIGLIFLIISWSIQINGGSDTNGVSDRNSGKSKKASNEKILDLV